MMRTRISVLLVIALVQALLLSACQYLSPGKSLSSDKKRKLFVNFQEGKVISGRLSIKGSDNNRWWSLTTEKGVVYCLQAVDGKFDSIFKSWQNKVITVHGILSGTYLSHSILEFSRAELKVVEQ